MKYHLDINKLTGLYQISNLTISLQSKTIWDTNIVGSFPVYSTMGNDTPTSKSLRFDFKSASLFVFFTFWKLKYI